MLKADVIAFCFDLYQRGSGCYGTFSFNFVVLDVKAPYFHFFLVHDVIEPFDCIMVPDVMEPRNVLGSDVMNLK